VKAELVTTSTPLCLAKLLTEVIHLAKKEVSASVYILDSPTKNSVRSKKKKPKFNGTKIQSKGIDNKRKRIESYHEEAKGLEVQEDSRKNMRSVIKEENEQGKCTNNMIDLNESESGYSSVSYDYYLLGYSVCKRCF